MHRAYLALINIVIGMIVIINTSVSAQLMLLRTWCSHWLNLPNKSLPWLQWFTEKRKCDKPTHSPTHTSCIIYCIMSRYYTVVSCNVYWLILHNCCIKSSYVLILVNCCSMSVYVLILRNCCIMSSYVLLLHNCCMMSWLWPDKTQLLYHVMDMAWYYISVVSCLVMSWY